MNLRTIRLVLVAAAALLATRARADVPRTFSIEGFLRDGTGHLQTRLVNVGVAFWDSQTGGKQVGTTFQQNDVPASNGLFTVQIAGDALMAQLGASVDSLWAELTVDRDTFPRQRITPNVMALWCSAADSAKSADTAKSADLATLAAAVRPADGVGNFGPLVVLHKPDGTNMVQVPFAPADVLARRGQSLFWDGSGPQFEDSTSCNRPGVQAVADDYGTTQYPGRYAITFTRCGTDEAPQACIVGQWSGWLLHLSVVSGSWPVCPAPSASNDPCRGPGVVFFELIYSQNDWHVEHMNGTAGQTAFQCF